MKPYNQRSAQKGLSYMVVTLNPALLTLFKHIFIVVFGFKLIRPSFLADVSQYLIGPFNLSDSKHGVFPVELRKVFFYELI